MTAVELIQEISRHRFLFNSEEELQRGVEAVLKQKGWTYCREYRLSKTERIDFYFPEDKLGLELKIKGSPSAVLTQLHGYAKHVAINALVLLTSKSRLATMPERMNGKPVSVISLAGSLL